jgi:DNA-binding transcriptional regulator YdaS (Cro superfamily)
MKLSEEHVKYYDLKKVHGSQKKLMALCGVKYQSTMSEILKGHRHVAPAKIGVIIDYLNGL